MAIPGHKIGLDYIVQKTRPSVCMYTQAGGRCIALIKRCFSRELTGFLNFHEVLQSHQKEVSTKIGKLLLRANLVRGFIRFALLLQ